MAFKLILLLLAVCSVEVFAEEFHCEGHDGANWSVDSKEGDHLYNGTGMEFGESSDGSNHAVILKTTRTEFLNYDYAKIVQIKFKNTGKFQKRGMINIRTNQHYSIQVPIYKECGEYIPLKPIIKSDYPKNEGYIGGDGYGPFAHMRRKDQYGKFHKN